MNCNPWGMGGGGVWGPAERTLAGFWMKNVHVYNILDH